MRTIKDITYRKKVDDNFRYVIDAHDLYDFAIELYNKNKKTVHASFYDNYIEELHECTGCGRKLLIPRSSNQYAIIMNFIKKIFNLNSEDVNDKYE